MKNILFLLPLILLTACDNNNTPKCWNDDSIKFIKTNVILDGWHIKEITDIAEIPGMTQADKFRYCRISVVLTNNTRTTLGYQVYRTITQTGTGTYTVLD